jgi:mannosylglycerate hydrolase MGH1-like protein
MDNAKAGAGAIEVGDLQKGLQSDIYMSAVWVRALEVFPQMAELAGDGASATEARRLAARARTSLREKLWLPAEGRYAFALLDDGTRSTEQTVWPATGLAFGLFDDARGMATAVSLARAAITTDWGARALASTSPLFDPLHYNNGTVWPFVTGFDAWGLYRAHNTPMGFAATSAVARTTFLWGLGANPEVFSGSTFEPLETAVPQQFFATSMLLTPLLRGLVGWEGDVPDDRVTLAPHLPPQWDSLAVERLPVGTGRYTVRFVRTDSTLATELTRTAGTGVDTLVFSPALPLGAAVVEVRANGRTVTCGARSTGADEHVDCRLPLTAHLAILVRHSPGWAVLLPPPAPERGARSSSMKVLSQRLVGDALELQLEGLAGKAYQLVVRTPRGERVVPVAFPDSGDAVDGYRARTVRVTTPP